MKLRIVNKEYPMSQAYIPKKLIQDPIHKIWLCEEVYLSFYQMGKAMQKDALAPVALISGYRSYAYQKNLFEKKVKKLIVEGLEPLLAVEKASRIVAMPGCSEHQLGTSIDVTTDQMQELEDPLTENFQDTVEGKWLMENAKSFGFILRYPEDKTDTTGITYEPWHYRYVGINHAKKIVRLGICLEEYVTANNPFYQRQ